MLLSYNPLPLFYDQTCTQAVPLQVVGDTVFYTLRVAPVKTRETTYTSVYIKNQSLGNAVNLHFTLHPSSEQGVHIMLQSPDTLEQLGAGMVHRILLKVVVDEGVKAKVYSIPFSFTAELTREG